MILPAAKALILGEDISVEETLKAMRVVEKYENQLNALAILYFSCDDSDGEVDALKNEITQRWSVPCN